MNFEQLPNTARPYPLQLIDYFLAELTISSNPDFTRDSHPIYIAPESPYLKIEASVRPPVREDASWCCGLDVSFGEDEEADEEADVLLPYTFSISVMGFFEIDPGIPSEHVEHLVKTSAPSLLYGVVREMIAHLTRSSLHSFLCLPTLTFYYPPSIAEVNKEDKHPRERSEDAVAKKGRAKTASPRKRSAARKPSKKTDAVE